MRFLFFILIFYSFSVLAETYSCKYSELNTIKTITFDRVTHSHFEQCQKGTCNKKKYPVIYADKDNLIFGDIDLNEEKETDMFSLVIIDKKTNLFTIAKISLPKKNINNEYINGKCILK